MKYHGLKKIKTSICWAENLYSFLYSIIQQVSNFHSGRWVWRAKDGLYSWVLVLNFPVLQLELIDGCLVFILLIFQDFALIKLFSLPCWIEHLFPIITPRSSNLVENFLFYETFLMDCHFRDLPDFQSFEARWQINGKSQKFSIKCDDLSVIIMRKRCSIQQGGKKTSSEQSPKKFTVPFFWGPPTNEKLMANPENDSP